MRRVSTRTAEGVTITRVRDRLPPRVRDPIAAARRRALLSIGVHLLRDGVSESALRRLSMGWGNQGVSADLGFLRAALDYAERTDAAILECGSGLTTMALGVRARAGQVWSLEHHEEWARKSREALRSSRANGARVFHAPLRSYGDVSWYTVPEGLPASFGLVVCDGPPTERTPGGRSGLWAVLGDRIKKATVLLDDVGRDSEATLLERLRAEGWAAVVTGGKRPYAVLSPDGRDL